MIFRFIRIFRGPCDLILFKSRQIISSEEIKNLRVRFIWAFSHVEPDGKMPWYAKHLNFLSTEKIKNSIIWLKVAVKLWFFFRLNNISTMKIDQTGSKVDLNIIFFYRII